MLRRAALVGCCALALAVTACGSTRDARRTAAEISAQSAYLGTATATPGTPTGTATGTATAPVVTLVAMGDELTTGARGAGTGSAGWSQEVAARLGWRDVVVAKPPAGFVAAPGLTTYSALVPQVLAYKPQVVVLWAAHSDLTAKPDALKAAVNGTLSALKLSLPGATVVLVGPDGLNPSGAKTVAKQLRAAEAAERSGAAAAGAAYVDSSSWFASGTGLVQGDGLTLTNAGYAHAASLLGAELVSLGVPARAAAGLTPSRTP